jgi:hypothetical protein
MARKPGQPIVIDASIARAAGPEGATHPTAKDCRDFLLAVLDICHRAVFTAEITAEWNKHQSGFAAQWRTSMFARKKMDIVAVPQDSDLRGKLESCGLSDNAIAALLHDAHLVEAARFGCMRVVALDEIVRKLLQGLAATIKEIDGLCWVNPTIASEQAVNWLQSGAPRDDFRRLGYPARQEDLKKQRKRS